MPLAIDIETLGMLHDEPLPPITCICMYHHCSKTQYRLRFWKLSESELQNNKQIVLNALDNATCIIGYNAVFFDLEFIKKSFPLDIDAKRFSSWIKKTIDMFMCLKYIFKNTCKLDSLLSLNKLELKTGSGNNAILLAEQEKWDQLLDYCMSDTMLTLQLFSSLTQPPVLHESTTIPFQGTHVCEILASQTMKLKWFNIYDTQQLPKFISVHFHLAATHHQEQEESVDLLPLPSPRNGEIAFYDVD